MAMMCMRAWCLNILLLTCSLAHAGENARGSGEIVETDVHSRSRPDQIRVKHLDLRLDVDFATKTLTGEANWQVERMPGCPVGVPLVLDTRGINVSEVETREEDGDWARARYELSQPDPILGSSLSVWFPEKAKSVKIRYWTSPSASALQWVDKEGTAGKRFPFFFTQSQAIHARSWIPCQDSPSVRITYHASVRVLPFAGAAPDQLRAVMAAEPVPQKAERASSPRAEFQTTQPIPSYLIALAVGDLVFQPLGQRTGVWAEPAIVEKAAYEFADTEKLVQAAETLFGPYRWGRYDILVLPPSFPYGGMENPRLTFATPTVLAGDRSQVALIAHELAHSWSGNLVTNATWRDFWLNEGFTVYLERRIVELVFGKNRVEMEQVLGQGDLESGLASLPPPDQILHIDLTGRDPDEGVTRIPYEKGALFLEALAQKVGRERVREFLRGYFDHFAFRSITTADFENYLTNTLFPGQVVPLDLEAWIQQPGVPVGAPRFESERFVKVEKAARDWVAADAKVAANALPSKEETEDWSTLEWLQFLRSLPKDLSAERLAQLDKVYSLTRTGNSEIACQWFQMAIKAGYQPAMESMETYLRSVGRRKFIVPLYQALIQTPEGAGRAAQIFEIAKSGYHPIAVETVSKLLSKSKASE